MSLIFTVEDTFVSAAGVVAVGFAPDPDTPVPIKGELVEIHNPDGSNFQVEIDEVEVRFSNQSCFAQKTVNRAVKFSRNETLRVMLRAEIRSL